MRSVIFDLDGTLVDTREAVRLAYAAVGVKMPKNAWGLPWREWLQPQQVGRFGYTAENLHNMKCRVYPEFVKKYAVALPALRFAIAGDHPVITGASAAAVTAIRIALDVPSLNVRKTEATLNDKINFLRAYAPGTYVDDDAEVRREVTRRTQWRAITPQAFLRSFSQQEPTSGLRGSSRRTSSR